MDFLVSAEYLYDSITMQVGVQDPDYSPFVLQLSRSVESELLLKVFLPFHNFIREQHPNIQHAYSDDFHIKEMKQFAEQLVKNNQHYTLGTMQHLLRQTNQQFEDSLLAQDFYEFINEKFDLELIKKDFLNDISELQKKYRNKSAHVDTLSKDQATNCKYLVRKILTQFLSFNGSL